MAEKISKQPSINFMVSDSARKIIDKIVANIGVKKRNDEACAAPPCCNAKNHNENEPTEAGNTSHQKLNQPSAESVENG